MLALLFIEIALHFAPAPPLSEQQQRDLATAQDGGEYREQAFYSLVENVRRWPGPPASAADDGEPIHLSFDPAALIEHPDDGRGDLFRVTGQLLQQTPLGPPYEDVAEWFIREDRSGLPVIVYVIVEPAGATTQPQAFSDRHHVQIDGRFYKRMRFTARDRQMRDYPAFVGRSPTLLPVSAPATVRNTGLDLLAVLAGLVLLLVIVFGALRLWVARKNRARGERIGATRDRMREVHGAEVDDASGLPDDPVEALAELRRRALTSQDHAGDSSQPSA